MKLYKCDVCGRSVPLRSRIKSGEHKNDKVCSNCYNQILRPLQRAKAGNQRAVLKATRKKPDSCLKEYFEYHVDNAKMSEESNLALSESKAHICHIFPKRNHKSVSCNLNNAVYLTIDEHTVLDKLLDSHDWSELEKQFPTCWYDICQRAADIFPLIEESTKFKTLFEEYLTEKEFL
jgi:DNA-directed RNA polymerase subunit RPC12/RpoP